MQNRPGVSLVEVLVAAVLLAIGIAGSLNTMVVSLRLRGDADAREAVVGLMLDRLAWFEAHACARADTSGVSRLEGGIEARWTMRAVGSTRILELQGAHRGRPLAARTRVVTSLSCD